MPNSFRETKEDNGISTMHNIVEPPVSDHPKVQRLSDRLREVVAYRKRPTGSLFQGEVRAHLLYRR